MLQIAICDDLQSERARLIPTLEEYLAAKGWTLRFPSLQAARRCMRRLSRRVQSCLLGCLHGTTGTEAARRLKAGDPDCAVIFTTSRKHGADAFDVEAFHYLAKLYGKERLFAMLDKWYTLLCKVKTLSPKRGCVAAGLYPQHFLH